VTLTLAILAVAALQAQKPTPTPQMDSRGLPLPYGVQPYFKPDVPLGGGPFKAVMAVESSLPSQVAYYPANLSQLRGRRMPVVIWGNGSCLYVGNRYRQFLTELASHGYLVIAAGPLGAVEQEVGPQSNPVVRTAGAAATPQANAANAPGAPQERVTVPLMKAAIDWAVAQNSDPASRFQDKLDLSHVVVMGHSCGGGLAVQLATEDSRVSGLGILFSGAGLVGARGGDPDSLKKIKGPILLITGDESHDIAFGAGRTTFETIGHAPLFYAWQDDLQHIGTFGAKDGGEMGTIAWNWLEWTTRNDPRAAKMFKGAACTMCVTPSWHVQRKNIDGASNSRSRH
jgi:dienelactone hydrolase